MDNDQITTIAREYAEEGIAPKGFSKATYEELVDEKAENVAYILRWLSSRFCLVAKERVKDEYNKTLEEAKLSHAKHQIQSRTRMRLLKSLFPEIAKEVEG